MSGDIAGCYSLGGMECYWNLWAEASDAAKYPEMHRIAPYNKQLSDPKVTIAKVLKPCSRRVFALHNHCSPI